MEILVAVLKTGELALDFVETMFRRHRPGNDDDG